MYRSSKWPEIMSPSWIRIVHSWTSRCLTSESPSGYNACDGKTNPFSVFVYLFPLHKYLYIGLFVFVQLWTILIKTLKGLVFPSHALYPLGDSLVRQRLGVSVERVEGERRPRGGH
jgi:hypothetical protein